MQLSDTEESTLAVLKRALNPCPEDNAQITASWEKTEEELSNQAVLGLPSLIVSDLVLSAEQEQAYTVSAAKIVRSFHNLMLEQENVQKCLSEVPFVILKGAAAAMYYPNPKLRQMGDIDIIVAVGDIEKAACALESCGYIKGSETARHISFRSSTGIEVELHRKFSAGINDKQNKWLDQAIDAAIPHRERHRIYEYSFYTLPRLENGLVLLAHINQHLCEGLGMRQIIDWMMYVKNNLDDAYWHNTFRSAADQIGMRVLAETTTLLCKKYLGLQNVTWCDKANEGLADELLCYVFNQGNFGRKHKDASKVTVTVLHHFHDPASAMYYLTKTGMQKWKAAQKYPFLKPFAWIYQVGHLFRKGLKRGAIAAVLLQEAKQASEEADFLNRLGVTNK